MKQKTIRGINTCNIIKEKFGIVAETKKKLRKSRKYAYGEHWQMNKE